MTRSLLFSVAGLVLIVSLGQLRAQEKMAGQQQADHIMLVPADLTWKDGPASLPKGVRSAVIEGDASKAGPFTMRLKLPAN